jgi:hypothetical protein
MGVIRMIVALVAFVVFGGSSSGTSHRGRDGSRGCGDSGIGGEGAVRSACVLRGDLSSFDEDEVGTLKQVAMPL